MKKVPIAIFLIIFSISFCQAQSNVSRPVSVYANVSDYVNGYVIPKVETWQTQGRYESSDEYLLRVNEQKRSEMIETLTTEAIDAYTKTITQSVNWNHLQIVDYDPNNQSFRIKSQFGDFTLGVPRTSAEKFEQGFASVQKSNPGFYFVGNDVKLDKLTFTTTSGEQYQYNSNDSRRFEKVIVKADFGAIEPRVPTSSDRGTTIADPTVITIGASDVDINIPVTNRSNDKTFAVIIANENYQEAGISKVEFALNDGAIFKEYCIKTLGLPEQNVHYRANATLNNIRADIKWISDLDDKFKNENINIIFYYSGHGTHDERTKAAYLLPTDGLASDVSTAYKLDDLYQTLGALSAKTVTVFLDACYSGAGRDGAMLVASKGVIIKAKQGVPTGNTVVFSSSQGDETSFPYREKGHGLFTYFLLKKLQETQGDVTLGALSNYITTQVGQQSVVVNRKSQTPEVIPAGKMEDTWQGMRLLKL